MPTGELVTRAAIWFAMVAWTAGIVARDKPVAKWFWAVGFDLYLLHIILAYGVFYQWSNQVAWDETARQTAEVVGVETGVGLIANFAFAVVLLIDSVQQWRGKPCCRAFVDGLVLFMIVNGAIVFGHGPVRWFGCLLLALIVIGWVTKKNPSKA